MATKTLEGEIKKIRFPTTGLLDTLTSTADSKDCPGVCMHALATVICYDVLEDVQCPSPSMKCCIEGPSDKESEKRPATTRRPSTTTARTTTSTTTTTEKPDEKEEDDDSSSNGKDKACPGVCVADRIAEYCEAYLTSSGLCKAGSKCCVSQDIYPDKPPADFHIPSELIRLRSALKKVAVD